MDVEAQDMSIVEQEKVDCFSIERENKMELSTLLLFLAILVCPISMGIMMWKMNKNVDNRQMNIKSDDSSRADHMKKSEE